MDKDRTKEFDKIDKKESYFFKDKIIQVNNKDKEIQLNIILKNQENKTKMRTIQINLKNYLSRSLLIENRWICFESHHKTDEDIVCFDVTSIELNKPEELIKYDIVSFQNQRIENLNNFFVSLSNQTKVYDRINRSGYPSRCIKCKQNTVIASMQYNQCIGTSSLVSLGGSVCINCRIRFSKSEKIWKCIDTVGTETLDEEICSKIVENQSLVCLENHLKREIENKLLIILKDKPVYQLSVINPLHIKELEEYEKKFLFPPRN